MAKPRSWRGRAHNPVPDSENRIHSDEVARRFGFRGGLVPGVTVSAYLLHPAVVAWGLAWLERGSARVAVRRPLYDGRDFQVDVEDASDRRYAARLTDPDGVECATAEVDLPDAPARPPVRRGDPCLGRGHERPRASRETFERLRERGLCAVRARWPEAEITSYLADPSDMPPLLRPDGGGWANPAFVLGLTNWALAANVYMNPWLHMGTEHRNHAAIAPGSELVVELAVADLFERGGHHFVDVELAAFRDEEVPVMSGRLRAIYQLRG